MRVADPERTYPGIRTMVRRIILAVPVLILFTVTSLLFLAARAPRTWAAHWATPTVLSSDSGAANFGAVAGPHGRWALLWTDSSGHIRFAPRTNNASSRSMVIDSGDVSQPTLVRVGKDVVGAWILNSNGVTALRAAILEPQHSRRVFTILSGTVPIEHPYLFAGPHGQVDIVFSWQRYGNFDVFLLALPRGGTHPTVLRRLTASRYYSFYPRAITDAAGDIDLVHLESCCRQETWNIQYNRYDADGHSLQPTKLLYAISYPSQIPDTAQWGLDLTKDGRGNIWGAFTGLSGIWLFGADRWGQLTRAPTPIDVEEGAPLSVSLAGAAAGGYLLWAEPYGLGEYVSMRPFDGTARGGTAERIEYLSGYQTDPHAAYNGGKLRVVWQTVEPSRNAVFESSLYRKAAAPTLAQRLGLGLGDPWEEAGVLAAGTICLATVAATFNILIVLALTLAGLGLLYLLGKRRGRWLLFTAYLSLALFATFVTPGVPTLFLTPITDLGFAAIPFGLVATGGSLMLVSFVGQTALRRTDDIYRAGIMAFLGVYFFAFLESAVFVQQHLGTL